MGKSTLLWLLAVATLTGCMIPGTYYDPFDNYVIGLRSYDRGAYQQAAERWEPLVKAGDCDAQFRYGMLYFRGVGIRDERDSGYAEPNYAKALELWNLAANQGQPKTQIVLGDLYYQGQKVTIRCTMADCGIQRNLVTAYKWYLLGEKSAYYAGEKEYLSRILLSIRVEMTQLEREEGENMVAKWKPSPSACKPRRLL
jgi:hypothetical protein